MGKIINSSIFISLFAALIGGIVGAFLSHQWALNSQEVQERDKLGYHLVACYCEARELQETFNSLWDTTDGAQQQVARIFEFPSFERLAASPSIYEYLDPKDSSIV